MLRVTFSIHLNMVQIPALNSDSNDNYPLFSPCQIYEPFTEDDFSVILGTVLLIRRHAIYIYGMHLQLHKRLWNVCDFTI